MAATVWVDAPARTAAGLLRDARVLDDLLGESGHRLWRAPGRWLVPGDEVVVGVRVLPGVRVPLRVTVDAVDRTAVRAARRSGRTLGAELAPAGTGTAVRGVLAVPRLVDWVAHVAARRVVVATALCRDGAVLAAQRARPAELAGRWELPGGRVEAGESEAAAVVRECREELGCAVLPDGRVGTDLLIDAGVLRVHRAVPEPGSEPAALEHRALRWVTAAELDELDWVDADRAVLPDLRALLAG